MSTIRPSPERVEELMVRAERRCECHGHDCRHHRPNTRCPKGLRGQGWHAVQRTEGAGDALWNLTAMCDACLKARRA